MANEPTRSTMGMILATPGRLSATQRVVQILKRFILTEQLEAGSRLPAERQLADSLNVSRTVLREALSQLIGEGLIERTSPRILCVSKFDRTELATQIAPIDVEEAELQYLIELRVVLEVGAIDLIVQYATKDDLTRIEHWVLEGERRANSGQPIDIVDSRFHAALLETFGNPAIQSLLPLIDENLRENIARFPQRLLGASYAMNASREAASEHRRIFEAIRAGDRDEARTAMLYHLRQYIEQGNARRGGASPMPR